jgi:hypothetical protein
MAFTVIQLVSVAVLVVVLVGVEILDWTSRFEIVERKWPKAWRAMNNRPMRLILLVACFVFLLKDFRDAAAISPPPTITIKAAGVPVIPIPQQEYQEPTDSLRRRTVRLVDDVEAYWDDKREHQPPPGNGDIKATGQQAEINQRAERYAEETERSCRAKFGNRTRAIVQELKAKGVDLSPGPNSGYFESMVEQGRCLDPYRSQKFRELAYHVDGADRLVVF